MVTETRVETLEEKKEKMLEEVTYKFRDESELTEAQLTDPDYSLKKVFGGNYKASICSKCHHCRR